jgi:hypothetical protein
MPQTVTIEQKKLVYRLRILRRAIRVFNLPAIQPAKGLTWCNVALHKFAILWNVTGFEGKTANEISALINSDASWQTIKPAEACAFANEGRLVVAHCQGAPHGHVAAVLPLETDPPNTLAWGAVPVLSMGHTPIIGKQARFAFREEPTFSVFASPSNGHPIAL